MRVRCEENRVNTDVFLKLQFFTNLVFGDPRGQLGTSFSRFFGCLRHHFSGLGDGWRRLEASGGRLGAIWRRLGATGAERTRSGEGKCQSLGGRWAERTMSGEGKCRSRGPPINLTTGLKGTRKTRTDIKGYNDVNR